MPVFTSTCSGEWKVRYGHRIFFGFGSIWNVIQLYTCTRVRGPSKCHNLVWMDPHCNILQKYLPVLMHASDTILHHLPCLFSLLTKNYFIWRYFHSANLADLRMAYIACTLKYIFTYCQKCTYILVFSQMMNNCPQQFDNQENSFQLKGLCIALNNLLSHHFSLYICLTKKIVSDMIVNITRSEKQF